MSESIKEVDARIDNVMAEVTRLEKRINSGCALENKLREQYRREFSTAWQSFQERISREVNNFLREKIGEGWWYYTSIHTTIDVCGECNGEVFADVEEIKEYYAKCATDEAITKLVQSR